MHVAFFVNKATRSVSSITRPTLPLGLSETMRPHAGLSDSQRNISNSERCNNQAPIPAMKSKAHWACKGERWSQTSSTWESLASTIMFKTSCLSRRHSIIEWTFYRRWNSKIGWKVVGRSSTCLHMEGEACNRPVTSPTRVLYFHHSVELQCSPLLVCQLLSDVVQ